MTHVLLVSYDAMLVAMVTTNTDQWSWLTVTTSIYGSIVRWLV